MKSMCWLVLAFALACGSKKTKTTGTESTSPKGPSSADVAKRAARAADLRAAIDGKLPVIATDATCTKFDCTTVQTSNFDVVTRATPKANPKRARIIVPRHLRASELAENDDYNGLECDAVKFTRGPLKGIVLVALSADQTHLMLPEYMQEDTGHGYAPELAACVLKAR